jgi:hypothetical protein
VLGLSPNLRAQGQVTARRIGYLATLSRADMDAALAQLRLELEKVGWTNGRNIVFLEPQTSGSDNARLPSLASEIVAQGPDLILVQSVPATRALMQATKSIPIVMIGVANPVEVGIVAGFAKPGGNVTGSSFLGNELAGKLLQLLKEAAPRLRTVAIFVNPTNEVVAQFVKYVQADAAAIDASAGTVDPIQARRHRGLRADTRVAAGRHRRHPCSSGKRSNRLRALAKCDRATRCPVRRPDPEGCQTGRSSHRATDAVQSRDQSQGGQGARLDDLAGAAAACGRGDSVMDRCGQFEPKHAY